MHDTRGCLVGGRNARCEMKATSSASRKRGLRVDGERKVASTSCSDLYRENATCAFITYMISHPRCWCNPTVYFTIVRKVNAPRLVATTGVRSGFHLVATDNVWNGKSLCHANEKPIRGK